MGGRGNLVLRVLEKKSLTCFKPLLRRETLLLAHEKREIKMKPGGEFTPFA